MVMSLILILSPGLTTLMRSSGTPQLRQNSADFSGPMNGTGTSLPFSSVVVMPELTTWAAHSLDMWSWW